MASITPADGPFRHMARRDEIGLSYLRVGNGPVTLLLHGFASSAVSDWQVTGWVDDLVRAGRRVTAPDLRGHGRSSKPHRDDCYGGDRFVDDLGVITSAAEQIDVVGYSMGAHIALLFTLRFPHLVRRLVLGGMGERIIQTMGLSSIFAEALDAIDETNIDNERALRLRRNAIASGNDLRALAACLRGQSSHLGLDRLGEINAPTLVAVGANDGLAGSPEAVASALPHGRSITIAGAHHANALGNRAFRAEVLRFLLGPDV